MSFVMEGRQMQPLLGFTNKQSLFVRAGACRWSLPDPRDLEAEGRKELAKVATRERRLTEALSLFAIAPITGGLVAGASPSVGALNIVVEAPFAAKTNHCKQGWRCRLVFQGRWPGGLALVVVFEVVVFVFEEGVVVSEAEGQ
ncbi:hypothetical protein BY996DRAFT_6451699 [Phakopsora pachyrhizi]|nr:hypothetical protein BY996DRAFT_6451699 [Phakopsora pachyrhizi]